MGWRDTARLVVARAQAVAVAARGAPPKDLQGEPDQWGGYRPTKVGRVVVGLTPDRIARVLEEADQGHPMRMCELLEEIEDRDPHLVSVLGTRKRAVASLVWEIKPVDDRRRSRRVAEFVQQQIAAIDNLEDAFVDLLDGITKGYALGELNWYSRPGEVGIKSIEYRPQRWFLPDERDPNQFRLSDPADSQGVALEPYRWVTHITKAKSGFPVRAGLGRVLVWWYLFKNVAVKDWAAYAEIFGMPLRVAKYPTGTKPADIAALSRAVQLIGADASVVISKEMEIEFPGDKSARSGPDVYSKLVDLCDAGFSKAVLGQTLTTEAGKNGGTRALGEVQNEVRQDLMRADAKQLARTLTRCIVGPLVGFQFGPDEPVPAFKFEVEPPEDEAATVTRQKTRAEVFSAARGLGVPVPLAQVQLELGIRIPTAGEELLAAPTPSPGDKPVPDDKPAAVVAARAAGWEGWRFAERDTPATMLEVERAAQAFLRDGGQPAWATLMTEIRAHLERARSVSEVPGLLTELAGKLKLEPFVGAMSEAVLTGEMLGRIHVQSGEQLVGDFPQLPPEAAANWWAQKVVMTPREFRSRELAARAQAFTIARFTSLSALGEAKDLLEGVIRGGGTMADFEDGLDAVYARVGMEPLQPHRLQNVFDNAVFTSYSVGRYEEMTAPDTAARRPYIRYHTMRDSIVRPSHRPMDGWVALATDPIWDTWWPQNGHSCRCYTTQHTAEEVRANGWIVMSGLPRDLDGTPATPDRGWGTNPAKQPHQFDWSRFPPDWLAAIGQEAA